MWPTARLVPFTIQYVLQDLNSLHQRTRAQACSGAVETCWLLPLSDRSSEYRRFAPGFFNFSCPSMAPQYAINWSRKFRNPLACPSKLAGFPMLFRSIARASFCHASSCAARVWTADSTWSSCCSRSSIRCCSTTAPETTTNTETPNQRPWSTTFLRYHVGCDPCEMDTH